MPVSIEHRISARDGLSLACREIAPDGEGGDGKTPLLCLPGLARNADDFRAGAHRIARIHGRRVFAVDYRGRGNSGWDTDPRNYRPEVYLEDIRHILAALGLHRVVAVGTSMGGLITMGMAVAMPSVLAGAIINDIGPDIEGNGLDAIIGYLEDPPRFDDWETAETHLRDVMSGFGALTDENWRAITMATYRASGAGQLEPAWDPRIVEPLKTGAPLPDLWRLFRALRRFPTLVFRGETSDILSSDTLAAMRAAKPDLITVTVPHRGHAPLLDEPECEAAIDDYLQGLP